MNKQHIKQLLNTSHINMHQIYFTEKERHFQYFNPVSSELYNWQVNIVREKDRFDLHISNIKFYEAGDMFPHWLNNKNYFRSFILATMIKAMKNFNGARLVLCASEKAARNYSNLGGVVVCIKNCKGATEWGVVK